jgi:hypothetical protein
MNIAWWRDVDEVLGTHKFTDDVPASAPHRTEYRIGLGSVTFGPTAGLTVTPEFNRPRKRYGGSQYASKGWGSPCDRR